MGSSPLEIIFRVYLKESIPNIVRATTITFVSLIGLTAMAGSVGGGGLGDLAIRYGYQRYQTDITYVTVIIVLIIITLIQFLGRLLEDVDASLINGGHAVDAGLNPAKDSIYLEEVNEGSENPYINVIVSRTEDKDNEDYLKIVKAFRTEEVAKVIEDEYKGAYIPTWK